VLSTAVQDRWVALSLSVGRERPRYAPLISRYWPKSREIRADSVASQIDVRSGRQASWHESAGQVGLQGYATTPTALRPRASPHS